MMTIGWQFFRKAQLGVLLACAVGGALVASMKLAVALEPPEASRATVGAALPGRITFARAGDIWSLSNGRVEPVTREGGWLQPDTSGDGARIVAVGMYQGYSELFVMGADGTEPRQITRNRRNPLDSSDWAFQPHWSPDGQSIAFITDRASFYPMLWRMNVDGTGSRQITFAAHGLDAIDSFAWSPDGRFIAATRFLGGQSQIYLIDVSRPTGARALTNAERGAYDPAWSPDGEYLAYVTREAGKNVVWIADIKNPDRPVPVAEPEIARSPVWSPLGNAVAFIGMGNGAFEIYSVDIVLAGPELVSSRKPSAVTVQFGVDPISGLSWTNS
ncbi:MAG: PD40 domain-containing protein [Chloroflexi bacterium]|nr:PD40 domain-containing protein [Chloroflexota bacterium]